jgi:hypothetical protein
MYDAHMSIYYCFIYKARQPRVVCVCVYVCMSVCMYVYIYMYECVSMCLCILGEGDKGGDR